MGENSVINTKVKCRCEVRDGHKCPRHRPQAYKGRHAKPRHKHRRPIKMDPMRDRGSLAKCDCPNNARVFVCPKHTPSQYPTYATHRKPYLEVGYRI